jgi:hypothetical protein
MHLEECEALWAANQSIDHPDFADYEGQEVSSPLGVPDRQRRDDHAQRVVINPPPQPQQEVVVDLISDDDE